MKSSKKQINENPAAIVSAVAKYGPMIMQIVDIIEKNPELISGIKDLMGLKEGVNTKMKISKRQSRIKKQFIVLWVELFLQMIMRRWKAIETTRNTVTNIP